MADSSFNMPTLSTTRRQKSDPNRAQLKLLMDLLRAGARASDSAIRRLNFSPRGARRVRGCGVSWLLLNNDRLLLHINRLLNIGGLFDGFVDQQTTNDRGYTPAPTTAVPPNPRAMTVAMTRALSVTVAVLRHGRNTQGDEKEGN